MKLALSILFTSKSFTSKSLLSNNDIKYLENTHKNTTESPKIDKDYQTNQNFHM
jgi:hypothetical protein